MISISTFRPLVLPYVRDCPDFAADSAVRFTVREFCRETNWLKFEHDPITGLAGTADYELSPPDQTQVHEVIEATYNGVPIEPSTIDELKSRYQDWRSLTGTPLKFLNITRDLLTLVPAPDTRVLHALHLIVSLEPVVDATQIDTSLYERWSEIIGYGARARLMEMSGQPYYDPNGALAARMTFGAGVGKAKAQAQRAMGRAVQHVQMRKWV